MRCARVKGSLNLFWDLSSQIMQVGLLAGLGVVWWENAEMLKASEALTLRMCQLVWTYAVIDQAVAAVLDLLAG